MSRARSSEVARMSACSSDLLAYFERRADPSDAGDLLSETLLVAWRRIDELPGSDLDARKWLFGVARHVLANAHRASVRRWKLAERVRDHLLVSSRSDDVAQALDVRDAVTRLPADQRDLVGLVHWEGFSLAEAAEIVGIPASTARGRYQAARRRLERSLRVDQTVDDASGLGSRSV